MKRICCENLGKCQNLNLLFWVLWLSKTKPTAMGLTKPKHSKIFATLLPFHSPVRPSVHPSLAVNAVYILGLRLNGKCFKLTLLLCHHWRLLFSDVKNRCMPRIEQIQRDREMGEWANTQIPTNMYVCPLHVCSYRCMYLTHRQMGKLKNKNHSLHG